MIFGETKTDAIRAAEIFVLPSHQENFGIAVVEAMALGRPVVATEGGGPSEIVSAADLGVLVRPADAEALAAAVIALIDDPARRRAIGVRAAAHIAANFSIDVMAANLVRHLDDLLSRDVRPSL